MRTPVRLRDRDDSVGHVIGEVELTSEGLDNVISLLKRWGVRNVTTGDYVDLDTLSGEFVYGTDDGVWFEVEFG